MAKKPQENDLVGTVVSIASKYVAESVFGRLNEEIGLVLGKIERKGYRMQERMLERLFSFLILVLGGIFIVLGIHSFLLEYLKLTATEAYLLVGAALLAAYCLMDRKGEAGNETGED